MNLKFESLLDTIGLDILRQLQTNARTSFSQIGRVVGLSAPAVAERIKRMEESGIIKGLHAVADPEVFNHKIMAYVSITTQSEKYPGIYTLSEKMPQVLECHHISGRESLILKIAASSIPDLDKTVEKLSRFGETKTSIVLSSPIKKVVFEPLK